VSIYREWALVKHDPGIRHARMLFCRSWSCLICRPKRRNQLLAKCASGHPTRLVTLTVSAQAGTTPEDRLKNLARAWRVVVQRVRRRYPSSPINYLAIVEKTLRGEPHMHILVRGPYIPQAWLSACMEELIASPIVDIRRIYNQKHAIRYVAKYVTKDPEKLGTSKRYWCSQAYEMDTSNKPDPHAPGETPWLVSRHTLDSIALRWAETGWAILDYDGETFTAEYRNPPGSASRPASGASQPC